jgi:hypothetical protein
MGKAGVKCEDCANLDLTKHEKHAKVGLGACQHKWVPLVGGVRGTIFVGISAERDCEWYRKKGKGT